MLDSVFQLLQRDGLERLVSGYLHTAPPPDAKVFSSQSASASRLPAKVDLRRWLTAVEDQQDSNSCTANAVAGAYEYLLKRHHGESAYDISRLFVYYNARRLDDAGSIQDEGSSIQSAIASLKQDGACSEQIWPFNLQRVNQEPSGDAYEQARNFLVEAAELVPTDLDLWRRAIASGHPIIFGIKLFQSFDQLRQGVVPDPSGDDGGRDSHGNHAMLCVGYSDPDRVFIVRNSWGSEWGDKGYCYMPYSYVMNQDCNLGDSWIVRQIQDPDPDETTWSDDEETILESVEGFLADISEADYNRLVRRMGHYPIEVRLALLFLVIAGADDDISSDEIDLIAAQLEPVLSALGSNTSPRQLIANTRRLLSQGGLVEETVTLFSDCFDEEVLATIGNQLIAVADADQQAGDQEDDLITTIVERWQLNVVVEDSGDDEGSGDEELDEGEDPDSEADADTESEEESDEVDDDEADDDEPDDQADDGGEDEEDDASEDSSEDSEEESEDEESEDDSESEWDDGSEDGSDEESGDEESEDEDSEDEDSEEESYDEESEDDSEDDSEEADGESDEEEEG